MNKKDVFISSLAGLIIIFGIISIFIYTQKNIDDKKIAELQEQLNQQQVLQENVNKDKDSYNKILITAINPYIEKAVTDYYGNNVIAPPYVTKIIENKTDNQVYEIKLEVTPYTGPHNPVGIDHITVKISPDEIKVIKFEHVKTY